MFTRLELVVAQLAPMNNLPLPPLLVMHSPKFTSCEYSLLNTNVNHCFNTFVMKDVKHQKKRDDDTELMVNTLIYS